MKKLIVTLLLVTLLAGCGKKIENILLGKWERDDGGLTMEFLPKGRVLTEDKVFTYTILDARRVEVIQDAPWGKEVTILEISDSFDELRIMGVGASDLRFRKVSRFSK